MRVTLVILAFIASIGVGLAQPNHQAFNVLLKKHVTATGKVNYKGFMADKAQLNAYLTDLKKEYPSARWSEKEKLAFWINTYNAFTIKAIIDHYPLKSITEIKPKDGSETIWKSKFITIGGKKLSLDQIENEILRVEFNEPRIHFAINCASVSCPPLRNEAFTAAKMEAQLTEQARKFFKDTSRNKLSPDHAQLSKIFEWFQTDFTKNGTLIDYINTYSEVKLKRDAKITYISYDWNLNE